MNLLVQAKIAEYCRKYFGEKMLDMPLTTHPLEPDEQLPSPELLKEKILIKNKKQHHHNHTKIPHSKWCIHTNSKFLDFCPAKVDFYAEVYNLQSYPVTFFYEKWEEVLFMIKLLVHKTKSFS